MHIHIHTHVFFKSKLKAKPMELEKLLKPTKQVRNQSWDWLLKTCLDAANKDSQVSMRWMKQNDWRNDAAKWQTNDYKCSNREHLTLTPYTEHRIPNTLEDAVDQFNFTLALSNKVWILSIIMNISQRFIVSVTVVPVISERT